MLLTEAEARQTPEPVAPAQAILYRFLAHAFTYPDTARVYILQELLPMVHAAQDELLAQLAAQKAPVELEPPLPGELAAAVEDLAGTPLEQLQGEYTGLFTVGYPVTPLRLLESVQREESLVGEAASDAALYYLRFGLEVKGREPDHLTSELEFMDYLSALAVSGKEAERHRRTRRRFLQDHLLAWAPEVALRLPDYTTTPLYREAARLLAWLMAAEVALDPALARALRRG